MFVLRQVSNSCTQSWKSQITTLRIIKQFHIGKALVGFIVLKDKVDEKPMKRPKLNNALVCLSIHSDFPSLSTVAQFQGNLFLLKMYCKTLETGQLLNTFI